MVSDDVHNLINQINELAKDQYWDRLQRNIGTLSFEEQKNLKENIKIAVLGTGGLGAPLATNLVYLGCRDLVLLDHDTIERSNLNRQMPFTEEDIGKHKVDVLASFLKKIDPDVKIKKYYEANEENIEEILEGVNIAALTLDGPIGSILVARKTRELGIPLVETLAVPYLLAWWFTKDSADYETCLNLKTHNMTIAELRNSKDFTSNFREGLKQRMMKLPGLQEFYSREKGSMEALFSGQIAPRSNSVVVLMASMNLALEILFAGILKIKPQILAPKLVGYDYLQMKLISF
ncbi:MAG: ThiF family adenylyltransferase [Candidatus Hodarchaeota archaeon]